MKISIAIPTHDDRFCYYGETINRLHDCDEVAEIVIVDDCSDIGIYARVTKIMEGYRKARVFRNERHQGAFRNKFIAVSKCVEQYAAIMDSDNIFGRDYLYAFLNQPVKFTINCPVKALPHFDYSEIAQEVFTKANAIKFADNKKFQMFINTGNYVVDRSFFISTLQPLFSEGARAPQCSDVAWAAYHLLKAGASIGFVPGMQYEHLDHKNSTYRRYKGVEPNATQDCLNMLRNLS